MRLVWKDFLRKCQYPILLAAGIAPIEVLFCANLAPEAMQGALILAAAYVALAWFCLGLPGKMRVPVGLALAAALVALGACMLPVNTVPAIWILPALFAMVLLGGLRMGGWKSEQELHPFAATACLMVHLLAQLLVNSDKIAQEGAVYEAFTPVLTASFLIFGAMSMLMLNRISLIGAVNGKQAVPTSIRRKNRIMTIGMMALTLLCASLPAVIRAIEKAWQWLMMLLLKIIQLLMLLFPQNETEGAPGGRGEIGALGGESVERSLLSKILFVIILAISLIIAAILIAAGLRILWKKLKQLVRLLIQKLNAYMIASSEDYVDEIADTRDTGLAERTLSRLRRRAQRRRVDEATLSPKERIRYRYLLLWDKHPEWTIDKTARENIPESAAQIYERARYSNHEVTQNDVEDFVRKA